MAPMFSSPERGGRCSFLLSDHSSSLKVLSLQEEDGRLEDVEAKGNWSKADRAMRMGFDYSMNPS